jgi:hypothetical protein
MKRLHFLSIFGLTFLILGCAGVETYPNRVAPGETVSVGAGWKKHFSRDNITVTITPQGQAPIALPSSAVRASINLYPDPLSSIVLSQNTGTDISDFSLLYGDLVNTNFTGDDRDWWQTAVFIDLPTGLPTGIPADITISNSEGESVTTTVDLVDPDPVLGGTPDVFLTEAAGPLTRTHLASLERVDHYVVSLNSSVIPHALQIDLAQQGDLVGYVINPKGDVKSLTWNDNAGVLRVVLLPTRVQTGFQTMNDLKFYVAIVAGTDGVADLSEVPSSLHAFDQNGTSVAGVTATISRVRGVAGLN